MQKQQKLFQIIAMMWDIIIKMSKNFEHRSFWQNAIGKQCRPDPDQSAPEGAVLSGSSLFAIPLSILRDKCIKSKI